MTFAKFAGAAFLGIALLAEPALADPVETAKAAGKDASSLSEELPCSRTSAGPRPHSA